MLARSNFSFEKRRKELDKKKKKEAKKLARAERKAHELEHGPLPEPEVRVDEFGNVVEVITHEPIADSQPEEPTEDKTD